MNNRILAQSGIATGQSINYQIMKDCTSIFETLCGVMTPSEKNNNTLLKADQMVLWCLLTSYAAVHIVDINSIEKHELMPVPVALAQMNSRRRTGNKSMLAGILISFIEFSTTVNHGKVACLLIDGQARVVSAGKPTN